MLQYLYIFKWQKYTAIIVVQLNNFSIHNLKTKKQFSETIALWAF